MLPDHSGLRATLSVFDMVLNRLTFLENTPTNTELASAFTIEIMEELEPCMKVNEGLTPPDNHIGDENEYSMAQRSVIADLVSYYLLFRQTVVTTAGDPTAGVVPLTSFLKSAKAGSVAVEFEQLDSKSSMMASTIASMMSFLKKSAIRKARALGCIIDICEDCSLSVACLMPEPAGFIVTNVTLCNNAGGNIPEQA